jgi:aspartate 1-decarboxylase
VHKGDKIIIIAYASMSEIEADEHKPKIVILDDDNGIAYEQNVRNDGTDAGKSQRDARAG